MPLQISGNSIIDQTRSVLSANAIGANAVTSNNYFGSGIASTSDYRANTAGRVLTTDGVWVAGDYVASNSSTNTALNFSTGFNFKITINGAFNLDPPTNAKNGQTGAIWLNQNSSSSNTMTFSSVWKFPQGSAPSLTATVAASDFLFYQVANSTFIICNIVKDVR